LEREIIYVIVSKLTKDPKQDIKKSVMPQGA